MTQDAVITQEMRERIGARSDPVFVEFEPGAIRRYADAIGDPNPLYRDEDYARGTAYGGIVGPPCFLGWPRNEVETVRLPSSLLRHVTGGTEYTYERPIRAGETLVAVTELVDLYEKQGRPGVGLMLFQVLDTVYRDLHGRVVVTVRYTDITFEGPSDDAAGEG